MATKNAWTASEVRTMWRLKLKGWTNKQISMKIQRSPSAISAMIRKTHDLY